MRKTTFIWLVGLSILMYLMGGVTAFLAVGLSVSGYILMENEKPARKAQKPQKPI